MAAAAFWIALAAVLIAGNWRSKASEQMRHETMRRFMEKSGALSAEELREFLYPPLPKDHPWMRRSEPGESYKVLRVFGTILMIAGPGLGLMIAGIAFVDGEVADVVAGVGVGIFAVLLGIALFYASRFVARPPDKERPQVQEV